MSRRRSSSIMGPPDRDVVMGPPPVPAQPPQQQVMSQQKPKDNQEIGDKYKKLKRRYFELEEKHKDMSTELHRSGERNVKMRGERDILLDRIMELEAQVPNAIANGPSAPVNASHAFPKSLLGPKAREAFTSNLRQAMGEDDSGDPLDPLHSSRHVGPAALRRAEEERKAREEEEARDSRRPHRRKAQNAYPSSGPMAVPSHKGKEVAGPSSQQHVLTYSPAPHGDQSLSSNKSNRSRPKPPLPPPNQSGPHEYMHMPPSSSQQQQVYTYPPPPPQHTRSQSPISPMVSPHDESTRPTSYSPVQYRNGNGHNHSPTLTRRDSDSSRPSQSPTITQSQHGYYPPPLAQDQHPGTPSAPPGADFQRHAKPKRLKAHTVTSKSFNIPTVPRDKKGRPMLPLNVGIMTVVNLGDVCPREHFHTERYIFPVGYEVTRRYLSTKDPNAEVVYNCTILDGGDGPKFQIIPSDDPGRRFSSGTATGAWSDIVRIANALRHRQHSNSVSGPDFFGLGQNTIKHLIQQLPKANELHNYVWQNFIEGGPLGGRHAAVIPALPEDYQEQGTLANHHPNHLIREQRRQLSIGDKQETLEPTLMQVLPQQPQQQQMHSGLQTIVLPPPTTSETLTIQEYQPPGAQAEKRGPRGRASTRGSHQSESPTPASQRPPSPRPRTVSRSEALPGSRSSSAKPDVQPSASAQGRSPYLANQPSPPPVPPTFASIMNAYPAPDSTPTPASGNGHPPPNGNASGSASNADSE